MSTWTSAVTSQVVKPMEETIRLKVPILNRKQALGTQQVSKPEGKITTTAGVQVVRHDFKDVKLSEIRKTSERQKNTAHREETRVRAVVSVIALIIL